MATTEPAELVEHLDAISHRLSDIASELRGDLGSPALAEARAARAAVDRAAILLGKWVPATVPFSHMHNEDDVMECITNAFEDLPDDHMADAVVEAHSERPQDWLRVTCARVTFLVEAETDSVDPGDRTRTTYTFAGSYPK